MTKCFALKILSPINPLFDYESVAQIVLPGVGGQMGVLPNHANLFCSLNPGSLEIHYGKGEKLNYFIGGGLFRFEKNCGTIWVEVAETAEQIDCDRAQQAEKRALERLNRCRAGGPPIEVNRALAALYRARSRKQIWHLARRLIKRNSKS